MPIQVEIALEARDVRGDDSITICRDGSSAISFSEATGTRHNVIKPGFATTSRGYKESVAIDRISGFDKRVLYLRHRIHFKKGHGCD